MKITLVVLSAMSLVACAPVKPVTPAPPPETFVTLQQEYAKQTSGLNPQDKNTPGQKMDVLQELLDGISDAERQQEVIRLTIPTKTARDASPFDALEAQAFVLRMARNNDLIALQHFLAKNCPEYIGADPLEWVLVATTKQPDSILILTKAYAEADANPSADILFVCLGRAFSNLRGPGQSRADFIKQIEEWWSRYGASAEINHDYSYLLADENQSFATNPGAKGLLMSKDAPSVTSVGHSTALNLTIRPGPGDCQFTIRLKNTGNEPIRYSDGLSTAHQFSEDVPDGTVIYVRDENHKILTGGAANGKEIHRDSDVEKGYTFLIMMSAPDPSIEAVLTPGEEKSYEFSLTKLCWGIFRFTSVKPENISHYEYKLVCGVGFSLNGKDGVDAETDWLPFPPCLLEDAPKPELETNPPAK